MYSFIEGTKRMLMLGKEQVGWRVAISIGYNRVFLWDMEIKIFKKLESGFSNLGIKLRTCPPLKGKEIDGVFITDQEKDVFEIDSINCLEGQLSLLFAKAKIYAQMQDKFNEWVSNLKTQLSIAQIPYESGTIDRDNMVFSCRFIGGYRAWSGDEDLCDACILDRKVSSQLDSIMAKIQRLLPRNIELYGNTGEKAWYYFNFCVRGL